MKLVVTQGARRVVVDVEQIKSVEAGRDLTLELSWRLSPADVAVEYRDKSFDVLKTANAAAADALVDRIAMAIGEVVEVEQ